MRTVQKMKEERDVQVREKFVEKSMQRYDSLADKVQELKEFYTFLEPDDKRVLEKIVAEEVLQKEETRQYGILLSGSLHLAATEDHLLNFLRQDEQNRGIVIVSLGDLRSKRAYEPIQLYLETHQHQIVQALAMIDYERTIPILRKIVNYLPQKEAHQLLSCVFLQRREDYGVNRVILDAEQLKNGNEKIDKDIMSIATEVIKVKE